MFFYHGSKQIINKPINKGYEMFDLYHEMDFSHAVDCFKSLKEISILTKNKRIDVGSLSNASGLSYSMISSSKRREKDITKVSASNFIQISSDRKCLGFIGILLLLFYTKTPSYKKQEIIQTIQY